MPQNIGCYDVDKKLIPLLCSECGRILGASFTTGRNIVTSAWLCCRCLTDIGRIADTLAVITEQNPGNYFLPIGLPNVFSMQDVDNLFGKHFIGPKAIDPLKVIGWCYDECQEFAQAQANKLSKRL